MKIHPIYAANYLPRCFDRLDSLATLLAYMNWLYTLIGNMFFRRQQEWERRKNAKIIFWVVVFSLVLALGLAAVIKFMSGQAK